MSRKRSTGYVVIRSANPILIRRANHDNNFPNSTKALNVRVLYGDSDKMMGEALNFKIAAMHFRNFLDHVEQGSLVITPGDRVDIILDCVASAHSVYFPKISWLALTGGFEPAPQVNRFIDGFARIPMPILMVDIDTHTTSKQVDAIRAVIAPDNSRKIATALNGNRHDAQRQLLWYDDGSRRAGGHLDRKCPRA